MAKSKKAHKSALPDGKRERHAPNSPLMHDERMRRRIEQGPVALALSHAPVKLPDVAAPPALDDLVVTVPAPEPVTPDDVIRRFHDLKRQRAASRDRPEGEPLAMGDEVLLDTLGYAHGRLIPSSARVGLWMELAPQAALPGFAEGLVGKLVGLSAQVNLKLPANHPVATLRGTLASFLVDVRAARELTLPRDDDPAFLKALGLGANLDEVMEAVASAIADEREDEQQLEAQERVLDELAARTVVDLPEELVLEEVRRQWGETEGKILVQKSFSNEEQQEALEAWLASPDMVLEGARRLKVSLGLRALWEAEGWTVTDEEVIDVLDDLASSAGLTRAQLKEALKQDKQTTRGALDRVMQVVAVQRVMARADVRYQGPAAA